MARPKVPQSVIEAAALAYAKGERSNIQIAKAAGVSDKTIGRYKGVIVALAQGALDLKREVEEQREAVNVATDILIDSHRNQIARLIAERGPFADVAALFAAWKTTLKPDEVANLGGVVQAVRSLSKQGLVTYKGERGATPGHAPRSDAFMKITATPVLISRMGSPLSEHVQQQALVDPIGIPLEPEPVSDQIEHVYILNGHVVEATPRDPIELRYPHLATLRERAVAKTDAERMADTYLQAATMLEALGTLDSKAEAERLQDTANRLVDTHRLTPAEAEYLRFAEEHEG